MKKRTELMPVGEYSARLSLNHADNGEAVETVPAEVQGAALEIAFNPSFFGGTLTRFEDAPTVQLDFADARAPLIVRDPRGDKRRFAILMPTEL